MASKARVQYVGVAPCVPLGARGQDWYTYAAPVEDSLMHGQVVQIPFGKRTITGIIMASNLQRPSYPTKMIKKITPVVLSAEQVQLARWIADSAHGGLGFTARLFLPASLSGIVSAKRAVTTRKKRQAQAVCGVEKNATKRLEYIRSHVIKARGQSLILVPEVAMLESYEEVFRKEFTSNTAALYHAGLSTKQKKEIWQKVDTGEVTLVIGTQKALFLPFSGLTCVCVDEEYVESYKLWDQYPRLDTVLGAQKLAEYAKASLVYASSYPSVRLRYYVQEKMVACEINHPIEPTANIYGFSFDDRKWRRAVPDELSRLIRAWARSGKRVFILHNKKDHSPVAKSLLGNLSKRAVGNIVITTAGIFSDSSRNTFDHVVWLAPELTLRSIDYRSPERGRTILARLARMCKEENVYVGTRYADFVRSQLEVPESVWLTKTLAERKRFSLSPYSDLVRLTIRDKKESAAKKRALAVREMVTGTVYGPYQELGAKKKDTAEYHLLVTGALDDLVAMYKKLPIDSADVAPHRVV